MCTDRHLQLSFLPTREMPDRRGQRYQPLGRSGYVFVPEGDDVYDSIGIVCQCTTTDGFSMSDIDDLINRTGTLIFSDEPNVGYKARMLDQPSRSSALVRFDTQQMTIAFECQPWRYLTPAAADITSAAGQTALIIENTHNVYSEPVITVSVSGSGVEWTLTIVNSEGTNVISCSGASTAIAINSELQECTNAAGNASRNYAVSLTKFPHLTPGTNTISWSGSGVSSVKVTPNWRDI